MTDRQHAEIVELLQQQNAMLAQLLEIQARTLDEVINASATH
jgi:hypothetical protein